MKETADIIELKKHQFKMLICVSIFLFLAFLGFTLYWEISYSHTMSKYVKTTAEVIDHSEMSGEIHDVVRFVANRGTDSEATHERVLTYVSNHEIGAIVIVYYDASNPTMGQLLISDELGSHQVMQYVLPIISILFGGIECAFLWLYYSINIAKYNTTQKVENRPKEDENLNIADAGENDGKV